jgi:hypothetical protein
MRVRRRAHGCVSGAGARRKCGGITPHLSLAADEAAWARSTTSQAGSLPSMAGVYAAAQPSSAALKRSCSSSLLQDGHTTH